MTKKVFIVFNQSDLLYKNGIDAKKNLSSFNSKTEAKNYIEEMKKESPKTVYELLEYRQDANNTKFMFENQETI